MELISFISSIISIIMGVISIYLAVKYNKVADITNEETKKILTDCNDIIKKTAIYSREKNIKNKIFLAKDSIIVYKLQGYDPKNKTKIMSYFNDATYIKEFKKTEIEKWLTSEEETINISLTHALRVNEYETFKREVDGLSEYNIIIKYDIKFSNTY
ncbi:hypothetical protein [Clostridium sp. HMSC19A10]|uniref:hypothetical protein n=1 Tax=Clostridium sp. HMSC19A10 TaxID=1581148 RepID=UPI0008A1624F|nr:hypothetical protein [Clostridium sp. HMSC19A10]OFS25689.1 hypothetical protein HMPREF3070_02115 [Clostridium sp. HMSC19A10]